MLSKPAPNKNIEGKTVSRTPFATDSEILVLPVNELLGRYETSYTGLTTEEAAVRAETFGRNEVAPESKISIPLKFLTHFRSPLTIILIIAAIISGILGQPGNAIIIFVIVFVSVIFDFFQEYRAERAAEELKKRVSNTSAVIRDGVKQEIGVGELVPGDVVSLSSGDIVPADARVIACRDLFIDQSALTGESFPAEKSPEPLTGVNVDSSKWNNYLFMGTSITNGSGTVLVVKTGSSTQYGEIVKKSTERRPETEFEKGIRRFGYLIVQVTFALVILVFLINSVFKQNQHTVLDSLLFSVALAVGLTPELLPMILSMNLARGAAAMSRKGVIVKRMAAIQNFGSMDVLCADKTGTLTENRVTVILHVDYNGQDSDKVLLYSYLNSRFQSGLKSPLDEAILKHREIDIGPYEKLDEIPFDFVRRRLSVVVSSGEGVCLITKGAPEEMSRVTSYYELDGKIAELDEESLGYLEWQHRKMAAQGYRVITVAYRMFPREKTVYTIDDENEMVFLGFVAFVDPLKETAGESIELLRQAGVKLKILTGDNEVVAARISQQVGFQVSKFRRGRRYEGGGFVSTVEVQSTNIVRGSEIASMTDDALQVVVEKADIFTRVTPIQKNRIINALKAKGHVVGFIGDGINDTPSMKVADVSISVQNAVDIAKESAEIILLNNDLKVLRDGVIEGRRTFGNTMKYILMSISSNFGNMFSAAAASLFLSFLPMLPIQILLNNLLYSFSQLALPSDNVDREYVNRPQTMVTSFIRNYMVTFGPVSSVFDFLTFFVMIYFFKAGAPLFQTAWFIESLFTQTLVIFAIRTRQTPFFKSKPSVILMVNIAVILAFSISIPFTSLGRIFGFVSLPGTFVLILAGFIIAYLALVELIKMWFFKRFNT